MSRRCGLALLVGTLVCGALRADDKALWKEYGLLHSEVTMRQGITVTTYEMADPTGALAAWEWQRSPRGSTCDLAPFCNQDGTHTVVSDFNYVVVFDGGTPDKEQVASLIKGLPRKKDSSLPAILTFLPGQGLVPNSARYLLGPASVAAFVPQLASAKLGFANGAEAQVADYRIGKSRQSGRLVVFNYPTPEMARIHSVELAKRPDLHVKRSGVLLALVLPPSTADESDTLLSRVQYEAKITWNDVPPPNPVKPLYQLLVNIMYFSILLTALCLLAGLIYAGMRLYRRRYGALESEEAMTTLHLN